VKARRTIARSIAVGLFILACAPAAGAAEIKLLCSTGLKAVAEELLPQFERASGHKVSVQFGLASGMKQRIEGGEAFDLAILTPALVDDLIKQGRIAAGTRSVIARSGLGVLVKSGARKPDISTVDAFKKALLEARSITYAKEGASGVLFAGVIQKLGIAEALQAKTKYTASGEEVGENVVKGVAEFGVLPLSEILPVRGAELLAMFPTDVQGYIVMAGGVNAKAAQAAAAGELLKFLMAPGALGVIKAKGMER
jgi:molybdate transport system substrate-binding protein